MRNLKKFLALVLAMMMVMSLMVTVNAASSDFSDADKITPTYVEAVDVLSALKVLEGDSRGFRPGDSITRAEAAAVLYRIHSGDTDKNSKIPEFYRELCASEFTDVVGTGNDWAAGYIGYAVNEGLVVGRGNGKFDPGANVTGYEMQTMLLRAVGYDKKGEFLGNGYRTESTKLATTWGILTNIPAGTLGLDATREMVAEMAFQTIANVPQVIYNELLGFYNYTDGLLIYSDTYNATLGWQNFKLKNIVGEVTAVDRAKGSVTVVSYAPGTSWGDLEDEDNEIYSVLNTSLTWEDIGYAVDVWGVATNLVDKNEYEAIIPEVLQGDNKEVHWKVDSLSALWTRGSADKVVTLAKTYHVYFNGELLPVYNTTNTAPALSSFSNGYEEYYYNDETQTIHYRAKNNGGNSIDKIVAPVNGLKVDLIDTDLAGEVESIVVTEYTVAEVAAITDGNNKGANGYLDNSYYFSSSNENDAPNANNNGLKNSYGPNTVRFDRDDVIVKDDADIDVGDVVTYVIYNGDVYTTVAPTTTAVFSKVVYDRMTDGYIYTIGGATYEKANDMDVSVATGNATYPQDYYISTGDELITGDKTGSTVVIYTDPYGYILKVAKPTAIDNYLFVLAADHISSVDQSARVKVILSDGTVETNYVRLLKRDTHDSFTDDLQGHMYLYTVDPVTGWYDLYDEADLVRRDCYDYTGKLGSTIADVSTTDRDGKAVKGILTTDTVIWDVRDMLAGKASEPTLIQGYRKLSSLTGATLHYVTGDNDFVTLAYLTRSDDDVAPDESNFIVFTTIGSLATRESAAGNTRAAGAGTATKDYYWLEVIDYATGAKYPQLLTEEQYAEIQVYGQGHYTYTEDEDDTEDGLALTFESFEEKLSENISWQKGALTIDNKTIATYDPDKVIFYSITAENTTKGAKYAPGTATRYNPVSGTDVKAYMVMNATTKVVSAIYILDGEFADEETSGVVITDPKTTGTSTSEKKNIYYTKDGLFTGYEPLTTYTVTVYDNLYEWVLGTATYTDRDRDSNIEIKLTDNKGNPVASVGLATDNGKTTHTDGVQYFDTKAGIWKDGTSLWVNRFTTTVGSTLVMHVPKGTNNNLRNLKVWVDLSSPATDEEIEEEITDNNTGGLGGGDVDSDTIGNLDTTYSELGIEVAVDEDNVHLFHIAIDSEKFEAAAKASPDKIKKLVARGAAYGDLVVGVQFNTGFFKKDGTGEGANTSDAKDIDTLYFAKSDAAHNHATETPYKAWMYNEAKDGVYGDFDDGDLWHLENDGFLMVFFKIGTLSQNGEITLKTSKSTVGSVHYIKADKTDLWFNVDLLTGADATDYLTAE